MANRVMRLNIRNEFAYEKVTVTRTPIGGVDIKAALPFGHHYQKIGDLSFLAEVFDQIPSTAFEQSLFVVAQPMQKIKHRITPRRMADCRGVIVGWQHNAIVNGLTKSVALAGGAIDAALSVTLANQKRN